MGSVAEQSNVTHKSSVSGIVLLLVTAALWSLNGALIKLIFDEGRGPNGVTIAFYRSLFAGLFLLPLARGRFHTLRREGRSTADEPARLPSGPRGAMSSGPIDRRSVWWAVPTLRLVRPAAASCVVFFTLMTVCFVLANTKTEAANAIILQYTSTFWIFLLSPLLLGEAPRKEDFGLLALAMVGIAIIFAGDAATDWLGLTIALGSGLFYGLLTMMIRHLRDCNSAAVTVANNLGSAVLLLPAVILFGSLVVSPRSWVLLVLMGLVQFGVPYYLYTLALVRVPAYQAALITLAEPVLNPVWAFLAVGEAVPITTVIGGGVILSALALFLRAARKAQAKL